MSVWGEQLWITYRDEEGGVLAYLGGHSADWYFSMGTVAAAIILLSGDAFIVRLSVVFVAYKTALMRLYC